MTAGGVQKIVVPPGVDETYDEAVTAHLTALVAGLAVLYGIFGVLHVVLLEGTPRLVMAPTAALTALLLVALAVTLHRIAIPGRLSQPLVAALVVLVVLNSVTHLVVAEQPRQTTTVMLTVVGAGAVLLSLRWLAAALYFTWGAWAAGAFVVGGSDSWPHYLLGMIAATALALLVNHLRREAVRELADLRAAAEAAAVRDPLTGLANRRGLAMVGAQMLEQARRQGDAVHCVFVDIDGMKAVNDALGHEAGDELIVAVGEALRSVTRATDVVARWGGDEFCVVGPGAGMAPLELERRVRDTVTAQHSLPAELWPVRVSAGGSMLAPWDAGTLETLLSKADQEMYLRRSLRKEGPPADRRPASAE